MKPANQQILNFFNADNMADFFRDDELTTIYTFKTGNALIVQWPDHSRDIAERILSKPDVAEMVKVAESDGTVTLEQFKKAIETVKKSNTFLGWIAETGSKSLQILLAPQSKPAQGQGH